MIILEYKNPYISFIFLVSIMQFTPQQLAGGPKFSCVTRIGNWQEEIALEEAKVENFVKKAATGNLSLRRLENKLAICTEIVPHTFSPDGLIRFGDSVILRHDTTGSVLACDPFERVDLGPESYLVSTVLEEPTPKARNTFRIVRPPRHLQDITDREEDPILKVGQPFLLAANESLLIQPNSSILSPALYLASTKKNERTSTKRTNRQMTFMTSTLDGDTVWIATIPSKGKANGTERFLTVGTPLSVSVSYQLTHRQTNTYITCDPNNKTKTEFGIELECYDDRSTSYGKIGLMVSEYKGLSTSQTLTKPDAPSFSWHFVVSQDSSRSIDNRQLPQAATKENILNSLQDFIRFRGIDAYWNLRDFLKLLEKKLITSGKIDRLDLKASLIEWGVNLNPRYIDIVLDMVDNGRMGLIDIRDFINLVRGPISSARLGLIKIIFKQLDVNNEGIVSIDEIKRKFHGEDHPLVSIGGYNENYALEHMLKCFERNGRTSTKITLEMFADYYGDLSASILDDDYFEAVLRSNFP